MTDQLLDDCYSCVLGCLNLIKSLAGNPSDEMVQITEVAVNLSQACLACIRSHEAGSVLPESLDRLADDGQHLLNLLQVASLGSPESAACTRPVIVSFVPTIR